MAIWPLLPLAISLAGALLLWPLPVRDAGLPVRRWIHVTLMCATGLVAFFAWGRGATYRPWASGAWWSPHGQMFSFSFDALGAFFVVLLCGSLAVEGLASLGRGLKRSEAVSTLLLVMATAVSCAAADLVTLCVGWGLVDLAFLGFEGLHATQREEARAARHVWSNLASTTLLIVAAVWVASEQGRTVFAPLAFAGPPLVLLTVAAWIRMGAYPFPGGVTTRSAPMLVSLCVGACFWSRLLGLAWPALRGPGWVLAAAIALLLSSLLAAVNEDPGAPQHLLRQSAAIMILGPMLDRELGFALVILTAAAAALHLTIVQADQVRSPLAPLRHWNRLPGALALSSLAGWPLTAGFAVRVLLLSLAARSGAWGVYLIVLLASALAAVPLWRLLTTVRGPWPRPASLSTRDVLSAAGVALTGLALLTLGLNPALPGRLWPDRFLLVEPVWAAILSGTSLFAATITGFVAPVALSWLVGRGLSPQRSARGVIARWVDSTGRLDWLYEPIEETLALLSSLGRLAMVTLEESFALGWTLLWAAVVVLYMAGR